jgi:hypothetical protein
MVRVAAMDAPADGTARSEAPALIALTQTGADGSYRLTDVPPGRYFIMAGVVETPTYYPGTRALSSAKPLELAAGKTVSGIDFRIEAVSTGLTVSGRVRRDGPALTNSPFEQITMSAGGQTLTAPIRPDGAFEFLRLRPDNYTLSINTPGFQPRTITVTDRDITDLGLVIPWTTAIRGRVTLDGVGPQPVFMLSFSGPSLGNTSVQARQTFQVTLPEGTFGVAAGGLPSGYYLKSIQAGGVNLLEDALKLSSTTPAPEVVVTLGVASPTPWVKVSGRIAGWRPSTAGQSMAISLSGTQGPQTEVPSAVVGADGSFEFPQVLPGAYRAVISTPPGSTSEFNIVVPNRDLTGIELEVPALKEVSGRIAVEDGGPAPRITMTISGAPAVTTGPRGSEAAQLFVTPVRDGAFNSPKMLLLNLQPDGNFTAFLPEGSYRLNVNTSAKMTNQSDPYTLKSFTYGTIDLLNNSISVGSADSSELRLTYAPNTANAWRKLSGRVVGWDPASIPNSQPPGVWLPAAVSLTSGIFAPTLSATIDAVGSFEFPKVYPGDYTARLTGAVPSMAIQPTANVHIGATDVAGFNLVMPRQREIPGRITLEGGGAIPRFTIPLIASGSSNFNGATVRAPSVFLYINPLPDGTFKVVAPEEERSVGAPSGLPVGYAIKSMMYGTTDLKSSSLKVLATDTAELRITLSGPGVKAVRVSGKVSGLDASVFAQGPVSVTLNASAFMPLKASVAASGDFDFPEVFAGQYTASVSAAGIPTPSVNVSVGGSDITNLEIAMPRLKETRGHIVVQGRGPMVSVHFPTSSATGAPANPPAFVDVNPKPDGTFRTRLPEGERRIGKPFGLPPGYAVKSITYGSVDLLTHPLNVSREDSAELQIVVTGPERGPFKVSGRVEGIDPENISRGAAAVWMSAPGFVEELETRVAPDGTFEFPRVFPERYLPVVTAPELVHLNDHRLPVVVSDSDIKDLVLVVPKQRALSGRIIIEDGAAAPHLGLTVTSQDADGRGSSSITLPIDSQANGEFHITLPDGQRKLDIADIPAGYSLKSFTYGNTDLRRTPLTLGSGDRLEEFRIVLGK